MLDTKQRFTALSPVAEDRIKKIEAALKDRKDFEAGKAKVEKWIKETDDQIQEEPDLECPLPKLNEIYIFYQGKVVTICLFTYLCKLCTVQSR